MGTAYLEQQKVMDHSAYVAFWKAAKEHFRTHPNGVIRIKDDFGCVRSLDRVEFAKFMRDALDERILKRAGIWFDQNYYPRMRTDKATIEAYLFRRVRNSGCSGLLNTKHLRKRYPHINRQ